MNRGVRAALAATVAVVATGAAVVPAGVAAAPGHHHARHVRSFDLHLLGASNGARQANSAPAYRMNHKLWSVAHRWAKHMASTGTLAHNPNLVSDVGAKCPSWTAIGENVGVVEDGSVDQLFQAYMHSPEHRANILNKRYRQVGIATVKVTRNGQVQEWDVMDFGNHC